MTTTYRVTTFVFTLLNASNRDVIMAEISPANIVGPHYQASKLSSERALTRTLYADAVTFTASLQFVRF